MSGSRSTKHPAAEIADPCTSKLETPKEYLRAFQTSPISFSNIIFGLGNPLETYPGLQTGTRMLTRYRDWKSWYTDDSERFRQSMLGRVRLLFVVLSRRLPVRTGQRGVSTKSEPSEILTLTVAAQGSPLGPWCLGSVYLERCRS
jgi:hypothetical protein